MYGNDQTAIGERAKIAYDHIWDNTDREIIPHFENIK
jgi:hypothetical protein